MRKFKIRIGTKVGSSAFVGLVLVAGMVWNQARVNRLTQDLISQATLSRNLQQAALETKVRLNELITIDRDLRLAKTSTDVNVILQHLKSRAALLLQMARRERLTLRQLFHRVAAARGHLLLVGSPVQIADTLEAWFRAGAADGFNVMPPFFPGQFDDFARLVVPILQERGLFRANYAGTTLRDHLGLKRVPRRPS